MPFFCNTVALVRALIQNVVRFFLRVRRWYKIAYIVSESKSSHRGPSCLHGAAQ